MLRNNQPQSVQGQNVSQGQGTSRKPFDWSYGGRGGVQGAPSDSWVHWGPGEGRTPPGAPPLVKTQLGMASPNSNLQSPSIPGTVNVAGTPTRIPTQSSGKSGGFNRGPVSPPPVTPVVTPVVDMESVVNTEPAAGASIYDMPGSKIKPGTFADRWTQGGYGNLRQRPAGQPMTLRDAFSILAKGGYGRFAL